MDSSASDTRRYLVCDGGPHLLLPAAFAVGWRGISTGEAVLDSATDYGRACRVASPIGTVSVLTGDALVFGPAPSITAWVPAATGNHSTVAVYEHWKVRDIEELLNRAIDEAPTDSFRDTHIAWHLPPGGAYLMFAGDSVANAVYDTLWIPLGQGRYSIRAGSFSCADGALTLFRLIPVLE